MGDGKDKLDEFARALADAGARKMQLRLFIAGMAPRSAEAVANLKRLATEYFGDRCEVEIVDIYEHPEAAAQAQVIAVPTLMRSFPLPQRKLIGSIADMARVVASLGLAPRKPEGGT